MVLCRERVHCIAGTEICTYGMDADYDDEYYTISFGHKIKCMLTQNDCQ